MKKNNALVCMNKMVGLGGVFVKSRTNLFFDFIFRYVNQVDFE